MSNELVQHFPGPGNYEMDLEKKQQLRKKCSDPELTNEIIQYIEYLEFRLRDLKEGYVKN